MTQVFSFFRKMFHKVKFIILLALAIIVSYQNLLFYVNFDFQMIIALLFAPFVLYFTNKDKNSVRFGIFALFFLILYPILKIQSLYFFGFAFFILFLVENTFGRLNNLPIFLLILLSPLASYVFNVFGFPIRLQLTEWASQMLSVFYTDIRFSGNIIYLARNAYKVAPECMGLNLLTTGLIITLYLISHREKETKKTASFILSALILGISLILIIFSNLTRIIGIVILNAAPGTISHEVLGLLSLLVYVVLPMFFIIKKLARYFRALRLRTVTENAPKSSPIKFGIRGKFGLILSLVILLQLGVLNHFRENFRNYTFDESINKIELTGFEKEILEGNILQFKNEEALVYIKPSAQFYGADHTPMICWKGSGYEFSNEEIIKINGQEVYFSVLKTETGEELYTAWWYDNGKHKTISQIEWRWNMMLGDDAYHLVNVTCSSKEELKDEIYRFINPK